MDEVEHIDTLSLITSDRPIEAGDQDELGFAPLADRLATALLEQASLDGLVFGIEGPWGSGKSSLLKLIAKSLSDLPPHVRPVVVDFRPWLIGDRDALLGEFFAQLTVQVENIELESGQSDLADERHRTELLEKLRGYVGGLEVIGGVVEAVPHVGWLGKGLKGIGAAAKRKNTEKVPLATLKARLDSALKALPRRIVVTIDDVDRLEPREVIEVLRLVRSVADFRNIIYLLCYDGEILAQSVQTALNIADGTGYLEKIIQVGATVPLPEPFQLRRWFDKSLGAPKWNLGEDDRARVQRVIDVEGGRRLKTPRHVVRVLNALHLLEPALRGEVDLADLVWLQLIKAGNTRLYRWIETYCAEASAASSSRVKISTEAKQSTFASLRELLAADGLDFGFVRHQLSEHLPGIAPTHFGNEEDVPLFYRVERIDIESAIRGRRLASPDHYRLYFALSLPSTAPRIQDFDQLNAATASPADAADLIQSWLTQTDPTIGSRAELMLSRMQQGMAGALNQRQRENVFIALSNVMDKAVATGAVDDFGTPPIWSQAAALIPSLLADVDSDRRSEIILQAFGEGIALGWLTYLLRQETFGHGRHRSQGPDDESKWLFSDSELDLIGDLMSVRYAALSLDELAALPNALSALFAWLQSGHEAEARSYVELAAQNDAGLVRLLEVMTTRVHSSSGSYNNLNKVNVSPFLDYEETQKRISQIESNTGSELHSRAQTLSRFFRSADEF